MSGIGFSDRYRAGKRRLLYGAYAAWDLLLQRGSDFLWNGKAQRCQRDLLFMRDHGYAGREPAGDRLFHHADAGISERRLSFPGDLDLYDLSDVSYAIFFICVLSDFLDTDLRRACLMLFAGQKKSLCEKRAAGDVTAGGFLRQRLVYEKVLYRSIAAGAGVMKCSVYV